MTQLLRSSALCAFAVSASAILFAACGGGDDVDPGGDAGSGNTGNTSGSGGSGGSGNTAGTSAGSGGTSAGSGGSGNTAGTGGGSAGTPGTGFECPVPTEPLITDFELAADDTTPADTTFGDFTMTFSGGTFYYPGDTATFPLTSDMSTGVWELSGEVGDFSGFGLYFNAAGGACQLVDASAFKGISFMISGDVPSPEANLAEPPQTVTMNVGTAANEITAEWANANKLNATDVDVVGFGRCTPTSGALGPQPGDRYNGSCAAPKYSIDVSPVPTLVTVLWSDLVGGVPSAGIDPAEITSISWNFPPPAGAGTPTSTPYTMTLTVEDLQFVE